MCGIAGICQSKNNNLEEITRMCDAMTQRGPNHFGFWQDETTQLTLGHRRLSIFDLSENGHQPMTSHNGRYVMVYNGEIYNAGQQRKRLLESKKVSQFRSTSDTEVLLEAFANEGVDAIRNMKGMFAIALYDKQEKELFLLRDRAGEKPLYYGFVNQRFVFASDLGAIRQMDDFHARLDKDALALYFRLGYIPAPYTIYQGLYKLKPGCILRIRAPFQEVVSMEEYWSMREEALLGSQNMFSGSFEEAAEELKELLLQSIQGQMLSDVPIGAYLSGGIDSPLVVSLMQSLSRQPIKTFTIGFEDPKYNEAQYAKEIAAHLGTEHTQLYVTDKELYDVIPKIPQIFTEPFADSSLIPTYLVSSLAKSKVTVSLSGDAGDELFCGYNTYYKCENLWNKVNKVPLFMRQACAGITTPLQKNASFYRIAECLRAQNPVQLQEAVCNRMDYYADHMVLGSRLIENTEEAVLSDAKSAMLYKDICQYHPDDILVKVDRTGMQVSLENRVPMLDYDIIRFAFRLPIEYKYKDGISKRILKEIVYQYIPKEMLDRPKKGFSVPIKKWLQQGPVADMAQELLADSCLVRDGYLHAGNVNRVLLEFHKDGSHAPLVWKLFVAEQWYRSVFACIDKETRLDRIKSTGDH